jgi:hypothetical protein
MHRYILICCFLFLAAQVSEAQFRDSTEEKKTGADTSHFHMRRSPWVALALSGVLPGAGQIYTGGWYKAPFIVAGIVGCLYAAHIQNQQYCIHLDSVHQQNLRGDVIDSLRYLSASEFYRDDRDKFYIYAALVYLANLLDAYISAHLFDFDVSEPTGAFLQAPQNKEEPWRLHYRMRF